MEREDRIKAFAELGYFLSQFKREGTEKNNSNLNEKYFDVFSSQIKQAVNYNGWFTADNVLFAIEEWAALLTEENLTEWLSAYPGKLKKQVTVGLVMAGNIPLVGFHDFLSVLISGHKLKAKLSSNDKQFFPLIAAMLGDLNKEFKNLISFTNDKLSNYDAVIATGSNNTARYFKHYFKDVSTIIRQNRNSVAVINDTETEEELNLLGEDIFRYFGLGCRSVSKIYVPENYNFDKIFKALYPYNEIINHAKYANNYDYNKAVYLMSEKRHNLLENGFFMLKEDSGYGSPIATLFFEYYDDINELKTRLNFDREKIQCVVSKEEIFEDTVQIGQSQHPKLNEYADGVDTLEFLYSLN